MARRKLTDGEKAAKKKEEKKRAAEESIRFQIEDMTKRWINEPTILFEAGEKVIYGNHPNSEIIEVFNNGKFYKVKSWGEYKVYSSLVYKEKLNILAWTEISKFRTVEENNKIEIFTQKDDLFLSYSQRSLRDITGKVYHFGTDLNPEYQRGNVWELEDKQNLIDSIFNNVDIGKFVFVHLPYKENSPSYEVLDGKQRVTAIIEFLENRFQFKGRFFKDLNWRDQDHIEGYNISMAEIENATMKQKLQYFLKLNTGGRVVDPNHLDKVKEMLKNE